MVSPKTLLSGFRTLCTYYRAQRRLLALDLTAIVLHAGVQVAIPFTALRVFQVYLPAGNLRATAMAAAVFAGLALAAAGLEWCYILFGHWLGIRVEAAMRNAFFDHIQRLPFAYFDRTKTGEVISRITSDLMLVGETAHHLLEDLAEVTLILTGAFVVMFSLNATLALFTLLPIPFILVFAGAFQKRIHRVWRENRREVSTLASHVENVVQGIREIKSFTNEQRERTLFRQVNSRFRRSFEKVYLLYAPLFALTQLLLEGYSLLYIALGAWMVATGAADLPQVFAFFMYSRYVTTPMRRIVNGLDMYQQGLVGYCRFREFLAQAPETDPAAGGEPLCEVRGELRFEALRFRYPGTERTVLDLPELTLPAGSICALVGPSGAGKSTLAALIPRFYEPTEGRLYLDGRDTATLPKRSLRAAIGIVAQRPFLFDGSIRDNLLLGNAEADDETLFAALEQANLAAFVRSLPEGLSTPVGEHGLMLSGGQAQRIAIARVFLKNPPILILDEATSALDTFAEAAVQEALARLSRGRTTLIIAHRLTTIRHATLICYLEAGRIVERGSHAELLERNGRYAELLRAAGMLS
ncbi:MAG: ABC transporter ATP-binding protein/permease [Lentisphaeraceae bacterium]|nr:ABC transporter ATP-binding protein/permease [Lentisphaeraceae bacterium]